MRQAAWKEQQERQRQMASQQPRPSDRQVDQRFSRAEQEAARFRQQFAAGKLTREDLEAKLRELMVEDASGTWWMVGTESGRWYRYDGRNWVPGVPPTSGVGGIASAAPGEPRVSGGGSKVKAFFVFVSGVVGSCVVSNLVGMAMFAVGQLFGYNLDGSPVLIVVAGLAGLIGLVVTWRNARRAARGY